MTSDKIFVSQETLRRNANERLQGQSLLGIVVKQATTEWILKHIRGVNFRRSETRAATQAYNSMSLREFDGINARQRWANWRTVPKNLSGLIVNQPLKVIDLCSGVGDACEVLACYLPLGSEILGLEYNPEFVSAAQKRDDLRHQNGEPAKISFVCQSILETFKQPDGSPVPSESIDLINCCGSIGVHFTPTQTRQVASEVARVLNPGGIAMIDAGPKGTSREELEDIFQALDFKPLKASKSCFVDRGLQVCFQKLSSGHA